MSLVANRASIPNPRSVSGSSVIYWLYVTIKREIELSYWFMESNFDAAFVPFPIFTTASLLYRRATYAEAVLSLACTADLPTIQITPHS